ncbi:Tn3 family transposase post-transcriptional regulator TnpC [Paraburkholderia fungorum]|uniref:Tn3 family transposase post-transcriptional regulator TnpC n=1 Tax=Paraburkholderia fungorum TaxID=134537 RepID=UPI0020A7AA4F|nr:Tn3 family transposase post-transcriptional regulator TnpC [Paraburkholderia fungorum]
MSDLETPYGIVDADALESLQQRYDTTVIQQAVDLFDTIRARCEPDGLRDDLLRLHAMAHTVINGASLSCATDDLTLVEQADCTVEGDDREFGKNRTLSFASSCNQFIVFSMDERKWRKLFDKQIGIL